MARDIARRLDALEQAGHASRGIRIFQQSLDDPTVYRESDAGLPWSQAEIDELSAAGWMVITIVYEENWRGEPVQDLRASIYNRDTWEVDHGPKE